MKRTVKTESGSLCVEPVAVDETTPSASTLLIKLLKQTWPSKWTHSDVNRFLPSFLTKKRFFYKKITRSPNFFENELVFENNRF